MHLLYAPRPLFTAALCAYRSGALTGTRWYRCLCSPECYRQRRRARPRPSQFRRPPIAYRPFGWELVAPLAGPAEPPACSWCGGPTESCGQNGLALCGPCLCAWLGGYASQLKGLHSKPGTGRRARYSRPAHAQAAARLMHSRMRPVRLSRLGMYIGLRPRAHTRHRLSEGTMHFLAARRAAVAQCIRRGFSRLRTGVWHDPRTDVIYIQADVIYTCDNITRAVRYV